MAQNNAKVDMEEDEASSGDDVGGGKNTANKGIKRKDPGSQNAEESKRAERRAANRRSAFQSRQRRKILIEDLQKTVATLSKENTELRNSNNQLRAKLETAMLENQLLRKQQGGTAPASAAEANSDSGGAASGNSDTATTDEKKPAAAAAENGATTAATSSSNTSNNPSAANALATNSISQPAEAAPAQAPSAILGSNNQSGIPAAAALLALNGGNPSGAPSSQVISAQAPSAAAQLLSAANQAVPAAQLLNGLHSLGAMGAVVGGSAGADPLLAARLALATASGGGLGNISTVGNANAMADATQQQQSHAVHSLAANPAAGLSLGGGQLQQLAMLLGGAAAARPADPGQQHLALLQAALARPAAAAPTAPVPTTTTAAPGNSMSQVMRALSETQSDQTNGAAPTT